MKKILFYCFVVFSLTAKGQSVSSMPLTLEAGKTLKQEIQMRSTDGVNRNITAEISMLYSIDNQELAFCLTPKSGGYDMLWIPMKVYEKENLRYSTKKEMQGLFRTARPFRKRLTFGVGPAIVVNNCTLSESGSTGIKQEMYKNEEKLIYHFKVTDPKQVVVLSLQVVVPVQISENAFGKIKYKYLYVADKINFEINVPSDPCKISSNIAFLEDLKKLFQEMKDERIAMDNANSLLKKDECELCKRKFNEKFSSQFVEIKNRYNANNVKCELVDKKIKEVEQYLMDSKSIECKRSAPIPIPHSNAAKQISDNSKVLADCATTIKANINVIEAKEQANKVMAETENRIDRLTAREKNNKDTKKAISEYEAAKKLYLKASKGK